MAQRLQVNIRTVQSWLAGDRTPRREERMKLAVLLGVSRASLWPEANDAHELGAVREWSAVDLEAGTLTVNAQMNRRHDRVAPKTKKAGRTIRIDPETVARLSRWGDRQTVYRLAAGPAWEHSDLLATTRSGRPIGHRNFHRSLTALCNRTGIDPPISDYELRHTAITLSGRDGHAAWQIADRAGTSERMITEVYRHRLQAVSPLGFAI